MSVQRGKIIFTGSFLGFFIKSLSLMALSVLTVGIAFPYYVYWSCKYFVNNLEIEIES